MRLFFTISLLAVLPIAWLSGLPVGEEVRRGDVRFERQNDTLSIYASDSSIIHYKNFDLSRNESVHFIQPNPSARVLNRIDASVPSRIDGKIQANGQVYLVNPLGMIFGPEASVHVGQFFAGAAQISDENFLAHRNIFFGTQGEIINQGTLQGEQIYLIGSKICNLGNIEAKNGLVAILSGTTILIGEKDGHCFIEIEPNIKNGIGAEDFIGLAIHNQGAIASNEIHIEGDRVRLEGEIAAQNGIVKILGDDITLQSLKINASGPEKGGEVLIGGSVRGEGSLRQSRTIHMYEDALIDVSAHTIGDGGKATLWSKETTIFDGKIVAKGGAYGGNGGFVETSGQLSLSSETGRVDTSAPFGKIGNWLLDPLSIVIATAGAASLVEVADCTDMVNARTIANTVINGALTNVSLCASTTIFQNADAPINITAPGVGITYAAQTSTTINSNVTTNGGDIIAATSTTILSGATLNSGSGNISILDLTVGVGGTGSTLQVGTGSLILSGSTTLNNNLLLVSGGGPISTFNIAGATRNLTINGGSTSIISIGGNTNVNTLTVTNSGSTTCVGTTTANSVILTNTTGAIDFGAPVTINTITTTTNSYAVIFEAGGTVTNATTFLNTGGVQFGVPSAGGNITFTGGLNTNQTGVTTSTNGTVATTTTAMTLGPVVLIGDTTMNTSNGALTFNSTLTGAHNLTVNTGTTSPLFTGTVSIGDSSSNTSLTINTTGANTIFSNTLTTVGGLTANNNVVFNNHVAIGGATTLPSLTTNLVPLAAYNVELLGGGTVTAFTQFLNIGTVTFGSASLPILTFTNGVTTALGPLSTIMQGTVQVSTAAAPLTFGTTVFATGNSTLSTNNGVMMIGDATLTGNATLQTSGANLTTGIISGTGNFTSTSGSSGTTTIKGLACGIFTPSNSLSVTITESTTASTINLGGMNPHQSITFNGLATVSTAFLTTASSYSIHFNAGGTISPFTDFYNTGGVAFGNNANSSLAFTNGVDTNHTNVTTMSFGLLSATSGAITLGQLTLIGNSTVQNTANPITFSSTINGAFNLIAKSAGGVVTFSNIVGGTTPLTALTASGSSIHLAANITATGSSLTFLGPVVLLAPIILTDAGSGISFSSTINGAYGLTLSAVPLGSVYVGGAIGGTTALTSLIVNAANTAAFASSINTTGGVGENGGNIAITANSNVNCSGDITALGGTNGFNGGAVSISSNEGSVTVASIDVSGGGGGAFPGGNAGSISLQPTTAFTTSHKLGHFPNGILCIEGSLTALGGSGSSTGRAGNVSLALAGRSTTMSVATITGNPAGSDLVINAGNLFIGANEAATVLGSMSFNLSKIAAVGDLVATTSIAITAGTIELICHKSGEILDDRGILYPNKRLHLIAGDPSLSGPIVYTGSGEKPRIAALHVSPATFRTLLFYGNTVLNFDRDVPPIAGIVDWVWKADLWDTQLLVHEPSAQKMLATRLDFAIDAMPHLRPVWLSVERKKANPVETAIMKYATEKKLLHAIISLPEFENYLKRADSKAAMDYIANIQTLIAGAKQETYRGLSDRFKNILTNEIETSSFKVSQYFVNDILEFTKPTSLSLSQWQTLIKLKNPSR